MADENVQQFIGITGVDEERARFYLESSAGELELAVARFYENDSDDVVEQPPPHQRSPAQRIAEEMSAPSEASRPKPKAKKPASKFATLGSLNKGNSDDEEEGQAFYAGGSEHSGQQVLGPSKKKDIVADMFKSVQEHGVEVLDPGASSSSRAFRGSGYRLGQTDTDSEKVSQGAEPPPPTQVTLKLWKDGFSLNDDDLRAYTDPANRDFLDSVSRGEIPRELRQGTSEVHLIMEDHRADGYKVEERRGRKPFAGQGYTLGSPAPPVIGAPRVEDQQVNEQHARAELAVDTSRPTTNLQIRLSDGSRLLGQFNHDHTVGDVRSFIVRARPQYETREFSLLSSYPSRELNDSETIATAGLLNAAIMQKLK